MKKDLLNNLPEKILGKENKFHFPPRIGDEERTHPYKVVTNSTTISI